VSGEWQITDYEITCQGRKLIIQDKAAIEFSAGFYDALGAGKSVEEALVLEESKKDGLMKEFLQEIFK